MASIKGMWHEQFKLANLGEKNGGYMGYVAWKT